ncbi:unnamed protein product [Clonostachys byssicola]|uniref:Heterokaryon incompatibility domain-containing protein n=1 Tax=Clonostachys byssicola TaxID=160290 RepID=A0A9N9UCS3_9HYPO|nr:unnamed protein product [Clonostachys byssicola]
MEDEIEPDSHTGYYSSSFYADLDVRDWIFPHRVKDISHEEIWNSHKSLSSRDCYQYESLEARSDAFRLLYIDIGDDLEPITCSLQVARPGTSYSAISYMWGTDTRSLPIQIDEQTFLVSEKLWWGLWHLRRPRGVGGERWQGPQGPFWIDAICINQADLIERNQQVAIMGDIYGGADHVYIWFGRDTAGGGLYNMLSDLQILVHDHETNSALSGLALFFENEYWRRVWIVQELILARDVLVIYGFYVIPWKILEDAFRLLEAKTEFSRSSHPLLTSPAAKIIKLRMRRDAGADLLSYWAMFEDSRCSDPRDKAFGFLGLNGKLASHRNTLQELKADYMVSLVELFQQMLGLRRYGGSEEWVSASHTERQLETYDPRHRDASWKQKMSQCRDIKDRETHDYHQLAIAFSQFFCRLLFGDIPSAPKPEFLTQQPFSSERELFQCEGYIVGILKSDLGPSGISEISESDRRRLGPWHRQHPDISKEESSTCSSRDFIFSQQWEDQKPPFDWDFNATHIHHSSCGQPVMACSTTTGCDHKPEPRVFETDTRLRLHTVGDARPGDSLCRFAKCDVAAIFRHMRDLEDHKLYRGAPMNRTRKEYHLVGRAMVSMGEGEVPTRLHEHTARTFRHSVLDLGRDKNNTAIMEQYFDAKTLRYLTG